jgi:hypothetical protein
MARWWRPRSTVTPRPRRHPQLAVPDAGISATDAVLVSGTITLVWANLGDY